LNIEPGILDKERLNTWKLSDYVVQFIAGQGVKHVFPGYGGGASAPTTPSPGDHG
jgi:hypothetical protein